MVTMYDEHSLVAYSVSDVFSWVISAHTNQSIMSKYKTHFNKIPPSEQTTSLGDSTPALYT